MPAYFSSGAFTEGTYVWHGLGKVMPKGTDIHTMFKTAGADFGASAEPIGLLDRYGNLIKRIDDFKAIVNNNNNAVLSVQSDSFHVIPNARLIDLAENLPNAEVIAATVLNEGRRTTFTARIPGLMAEPARGETIEMLLTGINGFDGTQAFTVLMDPTCVVCANTAGFAQRSADSSTAAGKNRILRITHRTGADALIRQIPYVIDAASATFTHTIEQIEAMARTRCDTALFRQFLMETYADELARPINDERGKPETERPRRLSDIPGIDTICSHFSGETMIGNDIEARKGTVWAAFNSITQFYRHDYAKNGKNGDARRYGSLMFGVNQGRIQRARAAALALTRA